MKEMKVYEVLFKMWNAEHDDINWIGESECFSTYKEALACAKKESSKYDRCDIDYFCLSTCGMDEVEAEDEWNYNRMEYWQWAESYEKGRQVPVVWIGGEQPMWRWNAFRDLKPRKK